MNDGSTSRRTLVSGSLMSRSTMTSTTSVSINNNSSNPMMIANRYYVGRKIGFGNFGEVRLGKDINSGENVAVKLESMRARIPQLKGEHRFYLLLGRSEGIPCVYYYGPFATHNALVLEYLGPNLEQLFMKYSRKFLYKTVLLVAMQLVKRFEYIHSKGIIFRDVKPENFVIGNGVKDGTVYMIDFGLAKPYINWETKKHVPFCTNKNLSGTARYMSVNTHFGYEQSRRDDLESLGYMLIYFLRGALPWQGLKAENIFDRYSKIGQVKKSTSVAALCYNLADEWNQYMSYVKQLDFEQQPDYDYLYNIFLKACGNNGYTVDNIFEWSYQGNVFQETPDYSLLSQFNVMNDLQTKNRVNDDSLGFCYSQNANYNSCSIPPHNCLPVHDNDVCGGTSINQNRFIHPNLTQNSYCATPTSANLATSTVLNDMKNNQQNRAERFKSHSRKPTPSHFCTDKKYNKKKHSHSENSPNIGYRPTFSPENNGSYGRFDNFKASFWNCCYKFRKSSRISDTMNH